MRYCPPKEMSDCSSGLLLLSVFVMGHVGLLSFQPPLGLKRTSLELRCSALTEKSSQTWFSNLTRLNNYFP